MNSSLVVVIALSRRLFLVVVLVFAHPRYHVYGGGTGSSRCSGGFWTPAAADPHHQPCQPVGQGYYSPYNDNRRYPCPLGTYSNQFDAVTCEECPAGTFSNTAAAVPSSSSSSSSLTAGLLSPPLGATAPGGAVTCEPCASGTYTPLPSSVICLSCDPSHYDGFGSDYGYQDVVNGTVYCVAPRQHHPWIPMPFQGNSGDGAHSSDAPSTVPTPTPQQQTQHHNTDTTGPTVTTTSGLHPEDAVQGASPPSNSPIIFDTTHITDDTPTNAWNESNRAGGGSNRTSWLRRPCAVPWRVPPNDASTCDTDANATEELPTSKEAEPATSLPTYLPLMALGCAAMGMFAWTMGRRRCAARGDSTAEPPSRAGSVPAPPPPPLARPFSEDSFFDPKETILSPGKTL